MNFKEWLITDSHRELAQAYRNLLQDVPQDPIHHPEGNVLVHVQLVRKAIPRAIDELIKLKAQPPFSEILADIDFQISPEEFQILFLSAWLHDIGKAGATTIDNGKISSKEHESPKFYAPEIKKLKELASPELIEFYKTHAKLINFLIMRHMDLMNTTGFPNAIIKNNFRNGKIINSQSMKLLLVLMWADKMGRKPEETILRAIGQNAEKLLNTSTRSIKLDAKPVNASQTFQGTPQDMNNLLKQRNVDPTARIQAIKNKFPNINPQELNQLANESYFDTFDINNKEVKVFINPSASDFWALGKSIRGILDIKDNVYLWDEDLCMHAYMSKLLQLKPSDKHPDIPTTESVRFYLTQGSNKMWQISISTWDYNSKETAQEVEKRLSQIPIFQKLIRQGVIEPIESEPIPVHTPIPSVSLTSGWNKPNMTVPIPKMSLPKPTTKWSYTREGD